MAPWGGAARRLGTNPHAIAVPGPNGTVAMSHDFATSVWAEGKLRVKFNRGETVPPGIMLNGRGEPSTDPREYYTDPPGSLLTAGRAQGLRPLARRRDPGRHPLRRRARPAASPRCSATAR